MNKPGKPSPKQSTESAVFLMVLGVIGLALPMFLCAGAFFVFGFTARVAPVGQPMVSGTVFTPSTTNPYADLGDPYATTGRGEITTLPAVQEQ